MIVYCCSDLIFATKVRATAEALGVPTRPTRDAQALRNRLDRVDDGRLNDPVTAVLVDLEVPDATALIAQAKRHDGRIPVVAFGSHVATQVLQQAREAGADLVLPRSAFVMQLPDLLRRYGGGAV